MINKLDGVHPDLVKVVNEAKKYVNFRVLEGLRTPERQKKLFATGASSTLNSRHLTGHAVDLVCLDEDDKVSWAWPLYHILNEAMQNASVIVGVPIEWGGDWKKFPDGPHFQLPRSKYP